MPHSRSQRYRGELLPLPDLALLEIEWRALEASASCSFFLSWSWIGTWLKAINRRDKLRLYRCYCDGELIAMGIIGRNNIRRRWFFSSRVLTLNELIDASSNMFIEYNGLLTKRGCEIVAYKRLLHDLEHADWHWDEVQLTNIPQECLSHLRSDAVELQARDESSHTLWIAPLDLNTSTDSILGQMSKNRRAQLRRTFREYEKEGALTISAARDVDEALDYFQRMGVLHTQRWQRIGIDGAFARRHWTDFHCQLIRNAFDRGEVQLLRITCGTRAIGYLYNFLWHGTVHMLQSGFATEQSNVLRPGFVSHILAMQFNAERGAAQYDFMIGDSDYKRALAQAQPPLVSVRLQKSLLKFRIENSLVALYRMLRTRKLISAAMLKPFTLIKHSTNGLVIAANLDQIFALLNVFDCV